MIHTKRHRSSRALFDPKNLQNLKKNPKQSTNKTNNKPQTKKVNDYLILMSVIIVKDKDVYDYDISFTFDCIL